MGVSPAEAGNGEPDFGPRFEGQKVLEASDLVSELTQVGGALGGPRLWAAAVDEPLPCPLGLVFGSHET
jgi:hypothetical protein